MNSRDDDPLVGEPMGEDEEAVYAAWSQRIEDEDYEPASEGDSFEGEAAVQASRAILEDAIGSRALEQAVRRGGRPTLDGRAGEGPSPKRQVRLPRDLDAALRDRAAAEHRRPSSIIRDALTDYLRKKAS